MFTTVRLFLSVFLGIAAINTLQLPAAIAGSAADQYAPMYLPKELVSSLSADGNTLVNGLPLRAVVNDPNPSTLRHIPAPAALLAEPDAASATFSISYVATGGSDPWGEACYAFPTDAKVAFNAAANIWSNILSSNVPIIISACWADLGSSSILGYSGGGPLHRNFSGATRSNTWYTGSLANALHGTDLASSNVDMHITYNKNFSWYYGTDGNPPATQHDLMTVVLHEIGHGLNFAGSMNYSSGAGSWGYSFDSASNPNIYDVFVRDGSGNQLITYTNSSSTLGSALTSNNIWFHGSQAMAANGGQRVKMYAPSTWSSGSSYSHLDYTTFNNTSNQLMVYAVSAGESVHDPGVVTRGLLADLGWTASSPGPAPSPAGFPWPMFLPAITGSGATPPAPVWGAGSNVCCSTSSATFSLTSGGITKKSYVASCDTASTWEGWVASTPGSHSFSWVFSSPSCGGGSNSFSYTLLAGKSYFFRVEWEDPNLVVYVYVNTLTNAAASSGEDTVSITSSQTASELKAGMQLVDKIQLGVPQGASVGGSCKTVDLISK